MKDPKVWPLCLNLSYLDNYSKVFLSSEKQGVQRGLFLRSIFSLCQIRLVCIDVDIYIDRVHDGYFSWPAW